MSRSFDVYSKPKLDPCYVDSLPKAAFFAMHLIPYHFETVQDLDRDFCVFERGSEYDELLDQFSSDVAVPVRMFISTLRRIKRDLKLYQALKRRNDELERTEKSGSEI